VGATVLGFSPNNFVLDPNQVFVSSSQYLSWSFATVNGQNWTIGPMFLSNVLSDGLLIKTTLNGVNSLIQPFPGYNFYSIADALDVSNTSDLVAYVVGWHDAAVGTRNLVLSKVHFNAIALNVYDNETILLSTNHFTLFTSNYKPFVFYDAQRSQILVTVPGYWAYFYQIQVGPSKTLQLVNTVQIQDYSCVAFDQNRNKLYFGINSYDSDIGGTVLGFDVGQLNFTEQIAFSVVDTNFPSVLVLNLSSTVPTLYVGFNGGTLLAKMTFTASQWQPSYILLPEDDLKEVHVSSGVSVQNLLFFTTDDNDGKVFSVNTQDFCSPICPVNGMCSAGVCSCDRGYFMYGAVCQPIVSPIIQQNSLGIAIAFIILFLLALIAAIVGFVLFVRERKQFRSYSQMRTS